MGLEVGSAYAERNVQVCVGTQSLRCISVYSAFVCRWQMLRGAAKGKMPAWLFRAVHQPSPGSPEQGSYPDHGTAEQGRSL